MIVLIVQRCAPAGFPDQFQILEGLDNFGNCTADPIYQYTKLRLFKFSAITQN